MHRAYREPLNFLVVRIPVINRLAELRLRKEGRVLRTSTRTHSPAHHSGKRDTNFTFVRQLAWNAPKQCRKSLSMDEQVRIKHEGWVLGRRDSTAGVHGAQFCAKRCIPVSCPSTNE